MPGGKSCSVATCKGNCKKLKEKGEKVMFFRFPKDPQLCEEWVRKCYRKAPFSSENKRICSRHFSPEDYEDEMKARILGTHPRKLKKTAVPSLLLPELTKVHEIPSDQLKINEREEQKKIVEDLLSKSESDIEVCRLGLQHAVSEQISEILLQNYDNLKQRCEALKKENECLKMKIPRILKKTAVPSLLLHELAKVHEIPADQLKIKERGEQKKIVVNLLSKSESDIAVCRLGLQHAVSEQISESHYQKYDNLKQRCEVLKKENECLKMKLQQNEENSVILKRKITQLELNLKECNVLFEDRAKEVFKDIFTSNQSDIISRKKSRAK